LTTTTTIMPAACPCCGVVHATTASRGSETPKNLGFHKRPYIFITQHRTAAHSRLPRQKGENLSLEQLKVVVYVRVLWRNVQPV
jgi:hypothetical protein